MSKKGEDSIDISSVNRNDKKKISFKLPLKNQKGPLRDTEGKFATKARVGSGGLSRIRGFNFKRAIPLIVVIAIVGGLFVFRSFATSNSDRVTYWYQVCRGTSATGFSGVSYWAGQLDSGTANYTKFRDQMRANKDGNCPDNDPTVASATPAPPSSGTMPAKKYHYGRSASPDCFSSPNCVTVVRELYVTLLARDPGPESTGVKDYASKMLDWGWTKAQVMQNIKQSSEYQEHQAEVQNSIMDYNPSLTDFMDTEAFVWFTVRRICYSATISNTNYWVKEIDEGRSTRKSFWEYMQTQQCAENVANTRLYDASGENLTEDGKRAKEIDAQLSKEYWAVFLEMWEKGGWKDWDGVSRGGWQRIAERDPHLATQIACEEMVWQYKSGIPTGLSNTCWERVTGQTKPIHSQDIMYGDYFGDPVSMEEAISRIKAVERGEDQSVSCQSAKAQVLPGCDTGAKYVPIADLKKVIEERESQAEASQPGESDSSKKSQQTTQKNNQPTKVNDPAASKLNNQVAQPDATSGSDVSNLKEYLEIENQVMSAIVYPECDEVTQAIEPDQRGSCVEYVQNAMALLVDPNISVTGVFDKSTEDHLLGFQISRNIPVAERGKIGAKTHTLLKKALEPRTMKSPYAPPRGMFVNNR